MEPCDGGEVKSEGWTDEGEMSYLGLVAVGLLDRALDAVDFWDSVLRR